MTQAATISVGNTVISMAKDFTTVLVKQLACRRELLSRWKRLPPYQAVRKNPKKAANTTLERFLFFNLNLFAITKACAILGTECKETVHFCDTYYLGATKAVLRLA